MSIDATDAGVQPSFGWTTDPAIIAIIREVQWGGEEILGNRKQGGVHRVWTWPLGHPETDDPFTDPYTEPVFSRVDVAWGRYLDDGCTFLVWEDEEVRAGTLADADWFRRGLCHDTGRTKKELAWAEARGEHERLMKLRGVPPGGVDFAADLSRDPKRP